MVSHETIYNAIHLKPSKRAQGPIRVTFAKLALRDIAYLLIRLTGHSASLSALNQPLARGVSGLKTP